MEADRLNRRRPLTSCQSGGMMHAGLACVRRAAEPPDLRPSRAHVMASAAIELHTRRSRSFVNLRTPPAWRAVA